MTREKFTFRNLYLASGNAGKLEEFYNFFSDLQLQLKPQPEGFKVNETGKTFLDNARLKATLVANLTGDWALADDSGLSVNALQGAPGVYSARYAKSDSERIKRLIQELKDCDQRQACFTAALCLAAPGSQVLIEVEGQCDGLITKAPRGIGGFGYDPVFEVLGTGLTFAEMSKEQKKKYSHRGKAFSLLLPKIRSLINTC